jgi:type IV pilus assembly protein PilC
MNKIISAKSTAILMRQISAGMEMEVSLKQILSILSKNSDLFGKDTKIIKAIADAIDETDDIVSAYDKKKGLYGIETYKLLQLAKNKGQLKEVLNALVKDYEQFSEQHANLFRIIAWPLFLGTFLLVIFFLMTVFVIPVFEDLFLNFGTSLPGLTGFFISLSNISRDYFAFILFLIVAFVVLKNKIPETVTRALLQPLFHIPVYKRFLIYQCASRLSFWFLNCHQHREILIYAIKHLSTSTQSNLVRSSLEQVEQRLVNGKTLGDSLSDLKGIPPKLALLAELSECSSKPEYALSQAAELAESDATDSASHFEKQMALISYLIIGVLVGALVIGMYLPIFQIGQVV